MDYPLSLSGETEMDKMQSLPQSVSDIQMAGKSLSSMRAQAPDTQ